VRNWTLKRRLWKRANLFIEAPVGEPGGGGVILPGLFERQMKEGSRNGESLIKLIWSPILDPDYFRSRVWGQSETSVKDQGSHVLVSDCGAQRACFKA